MFNAIILGSIIAVFFVCYCAQPGGAAESWQAFRNTAELHDLKKQYALGAANYEKALKLVPTNDANSRAKVESALATDLINVKEYDKARPYCEDVVKTVTRLRAARMLDPDVLLAVLSLKEVCSLNLSLKMPYEQRQRLTQEFHGLWLALNDAVGTPGGDVIGQRLAYARGFIALGKKKEAEQELINMLKKFGDNPQSAPAKLALAVLQKDLKRPALFNQMTEDMRRKGKGTNVAAGIATAQLWAADYADARDTLDRELAKSMKGTRESADDEITLNRIYEATYLDCSAYAKAEKSARRIVDLLTLYHKNSPEWRIARQQLADILQRLGRSKEADAYLPPRGSSPPRKDLEFLLTDAEKTELKKVQKSGVHPRSNDTNK